VIRGYEHDDSQYVLVEDEELKKITPRSGRNMEIVAFVKEEQMFIRPRDHGLTVHTMFFENEIRHVESYGKTNEHIHLKRQEIKLVEQLVETLSEDFEPSKYHDTFQQNLKALIESKQKGRTFMEEPKSGRAPVIDMMEVFKRQSEAANKAKPSRSHRDQEDRRRLAS
jgi:DNA end-binding protein Ku